MPVKSLRAASLRLTLAVVLQPGAACHGESVVVDDTADTEDTDTSPEVDCVEPPLLSQQNNLVDMACAAEFVCRALPGSDTDPDFLRDCFPRRTLALHACLRTESALACLANVRQDRNCVGLQSEPCQKAFECDPR
jgi:hypothetical protein